LRSTSPGEIVNELLHLVTDLISLCTSRTVIVSQLISFPRTRHQHLHSICSVNRNLCREIPAAGHVFRRHESGIVRALPELFLRDHVHLNTAGMRQYWTSVVRRQLPRSQRYVCPELRLVCGTVCVYFDIFIFYVLRNYFSICFSSDLGH